MTDAPLILDKECKRCGKRKPTNPDWSRNWNDTWIAGLHAGCLCPDCMTDEEDLEGQINELAGGRMVYTTFDGMSHDEAWDAWIAFTVPLLTEMYRTPEKLRAQADELDAVRQDFAAKAMTGLMRALAADLETEAQR